MGLLSATSLSRACSFPGSPRAWLCGCSPSSEVRLLMATRATQHPSIDKAGALTETLDISALGGLRTHRLDRRTDREQAGTK